MIRHSFAFKIEEGRVGTVLTEIGRAFQGIKKAAIKNEADNFSLWRCDTFFFGYYETNDDKKDPVTTELMKPVQQTIDEEAEWTSDFSKDMREMYQDYGIVRSDKSMIRHRVFMTHLINSETEEYKRRHDALVEARTEVDPGPDSNFTIWNYGDYIFGYDEIDTSMEHEMTGEEKRDTIAWETKMLEIMEWITDDVDWITDMHHSHVLKVFSI